MNELPETTRPSREPRKAWGTRLGLALAIAFALHSGPTLAATLHVEGGQLLGAFGVDVGGTLYDVEFVDGTCVDLFAGCDEAADFTFTTTTDAGLASAALQNQVFLDTAEGAFDSVPELTAGCASNDFLTCRVTTPVARSFDFSGNPRTTVTVVSISNRTSELNNLAPSGHAEFVTDGMGDTGGGDFRVYARWSLSRFEACSDDLTVADLETGLLWERKTTTGGLHSVGNSYSWSSTGDQDLQSTAEDGTVYTVFLASLNAEPGFRGHTDWRLPYISELQSIMIGSGVTFSNANVDPPDPAMGTNTTDQATTCGSAPCIDPNFAAIGGPTASSPSWAANSFGNGSTSAWQGRFFNGTVGIIFKSNQTFVRAVRSGSCDPSDVDSDGDRVLDRVDNCPAAPNADQLNTDGDTQGNACDTDNDGDSWEDITETAFGTDPLDPASNPEASAFDARLDDLRITFTDPELDGDPLADPAADDLNSSDTYADGVFGAPSAVLLGSVLAGDEAAGVLRMHRPVISPGTQNLDQIIQLAPAGPGPLTASSVFLWDEPSALEAYSAWAIGAGEHVILAFVRDTVSPGADFAAVFLEVGVVDRIFRVRGFTAQELAGVARIELRIDLTDNGATLTPSACVRLDAGSCLPVDGTAGLADPSVPAFVRTNSHFTAAAVTTIRPAAPDVDGDGSNGLGDNCPVTANPSQANVDGDKFGDACDHDIDGDGVLNPADAFPNDAAASVDTDGDGKPDSLNGASTTGLVEDLDDDNDGLLDTVETDTGAYVSPSNTGSKPLVADTDGDGLSDGDEVNGLGTNPVLADSDGDGLPDGADLSPLNFGDCRALNPQLRLVWGRDAPFGVDHQNDPGIGHRYVLDAAADPLPGLASNDPRFSSSLPESLRSGLQALFDGARADYPSLPATNNGLQIGGLQIGTVIATDPLPPQGTPGSPSLLYIINRSLLEDPVTDPDFGPLEGFASAASTASTSAAPGSGQRVHRRRHRPPSHRPRLSPVPGRSRRDRGPRGRTPLWPAPCAPRRSRSLHGRPRRARPHPRRDGLHTRRRQHPTRPLHRHPGPGMPGHRTPNCSGEDTGEDHNPLYHYLRYVVGDSAADLTAAGIVPGAWDADSVPLVAWKIEFGFFCISCNDPNLPFYNFTLVEVLPGGIEVERAVFSKITLGEINGDPGALPQPIPPLTVLLAQSSGLKLRASSVEPVVGEDPRMDIVFAAPLYPPASEDDPSVLVAPNLVKIVEPTPGTFTTELLDTGTEVETSPVYLIQSGGLADPSDGIYLVPADGSPVGAEDQLTESTYKCTHCFPAMTIADVAPSALANNNQKVPEPGFATGLAAGLAGLLALARRRRRAQDGLGARGV